MKMNERLCVTSLAAVLLALSGCPAAQNNTPGVFNALDPSLQCPSGQVGWDFSTGGANGQGITDSTLNNQITIVSATYGANDGVPTGNWDTQFQKACNGLSSCSRTVFQSSAGDLDPDPGHTKNFVVVYTCGTEPTQYTLTYAAEAGNDAVTLTCGGHINIQSATYGPSNASPYTGNYTAAITSQCNGLRLCNLEAVQNQVGGGCAGASGSGNAVHQYGPDPSCGQVKNAWINYTCGDNPTVNTYEVAQGSPVDFQCPLVQPSAAEVLPIVNIQATYGGNQGVPENNWTSYIDNSCENQLSCSLVVDGAGAPPDPAYGKTKDFQMSYQCGSEPLTYFIYEPAEAGGDTITANCGPTIQIISATYGPNFGTPYTGNFTGNAQPGCDGSRRCQLPRGPGPGIPVGNALFGSDPAPGQTKSWQFTYTCGSNTAVQTTTFTEDQVIDFSCPLSSALSIEGTGIRLVSATYGANCNADGGVNVPTDNAFAQIQSACYDLQSCSYTMVFPNGVDPAPGCAKELDVEYQCGQTGTVISTTIPAEANGKVLNLSCAPQINVLGATYGGNCDDAGFNVPLDNETSELQAACQGVPGTCSYVVSGLGDPAPNCAKSYVAQYQCGADPTVKTATVAAEASGQTLTLNCPTPSQPLNDTACVPGQCFGQESRDMNLNCVADLSKVVLPTLTKTALTGESYFSSAATPNTAASELDLTVLTENTGYNINVQFAFNGSLPSSIAPPDAGSVADAGSASAQQAVAQALDGGVVSTAAPPPVANAVIWAYDQFVPNGQSSPIVNGFRCVIGTVPVFETGPQTLGGSITRGVIPPACFGQTVPSWGDAAKSQGMTEAAFRSAYTLINDSFSLVAVSFDPEGQTVTPIEQGTTAPQTVPVPNPIGFYYNPTLLWTDFYDYYMQTATNVQGSTVDVLGVKISTQANPVSVYVAFPQSNNMTIVAEKANLQTTQATVALGNGAGGGTAPPLPTLDLDLDWYEDGDSPGRNPYSASGTPLSANVETITQEQLGATVELTREDSYEAALAAGNPWPAQGLAAVVGGLQSTLLTDPSSGGRTATVQVQLDEPTRARLWQPESSGGFLAPTDLPDGMTQFRVRVCLDMDGILRTGSTYVEGGGTLSTTQLGGTTFTAGFVAGYQCQVVDQILIIARNAEQYPLSAAGSATPQASNEKKQGGSLVKTDNNIAIDTNCGDNLGTTATCETDTNSLGTSGYVQITLFGAVETNIAQPCGGSTGVPCISGSGRNVTSELQNEVLGFTVFDESATDGEGEEISLLPDIDSIKDIIDEINDEPKPAPVHPFAELADLSGDIEGVGVGIEAGPATLVVGVVPLQFVADLVAGVGVGLTFKAAENDDVDPPPPTYPCLSGNGPCYVLQKTPATQSAAASSCNAMGGRLAEVDGTDPTAIASLVTAGSGLTGAAWVGGQLAYSYTDAACTDPTQPPNDPKAPGDKTSCPSVSTTHYRWIDSGREFAQQSGTNPTVLTNQSDVLNFYPDGGTIPDSTNFPANDSQYLTGLTSAQGESPVPAPAGVTFTPGNSSFHAETYASGSTANSLPYFCEFDPAASATYLQQSLTATLGASGGVDVAACTPSATAGLCLTVGVTFIEVALNLAETTNQTLLFDSNNNVKGEYGNLDISLTWDITALIAAIKVELRLIFETISWELWKFEGFKLIGGTIFDLDFPTTQEATTTP